MSIHVSPWARRAMHRLRRLRLQIAVAAALLLLAILAVCRAAEAQSLPPVVVETPKKQPKATPKAATKGPTTAPVTQPAAAPAGQSLALDPAATPPGGSLTVPTTAQAQAILARVPGSVVVVPDTAYKNSTPAATIKDVLDYVPGVFVAAEVGRGHAPLDPRLGPVAQLPPARRPALHGRHPDQHRRRLRRLPGDRPDRLPLRRGLQGRQRAAVRRQFARRRHQLRDADRPRRQPARRQRRHRQLRLPPPAGELGRRQRARSIIFVTGSWQEQDGFRDHSWGESTRASANIGYQLSPDVETRFYFNANDITQRIPGGVTKAVALTVAARPRRPSTSPTTGSATSTPGASPTRRRCGSRQAPASSSALFGVDRHLMHPIFQWLDYQYEDYGGFVRVTDERCDRRLQATGSSPASPCTTARSTRGSSPTGRMRRRARCCRARSTSRRTSRPTRRTPSTSCRTVALVAGTQFLHATRDRDRPVPVQRRSVGQHASSTSGARRSACCGRCDRTWQVFANVSRSAEVPSFGENSLRTCHRRSPTSRRRRATTYEIGTRGRRPDYTWDLAALPHAEIDNELQCLFSSLRQLQRSSMPTRRCTRASRSASASPC